MSKKRKTGKGKTNIPAKKQREIIDLWKKKHSQREIAAMTGVSRCSIQRFIKTLRDNPEIDVQGLADEVEHFGNVQGSAPKGMPDQGHVEVRDDIATDGTVLIKTNGRRPPSPEQMDRLCGIDGLRWKPRYYRGNIWEGFYKLKNWLPDNVLEKLIDQVQKGACTVRELRDALAMEEAGHRIVELTQGRVVYQRIVEEVIEDAMLEFTKEVIKPLPKKLRKPQVIVDPDGYTLNAGFYDFHCGMYAHDEEVGANFDVDIAVNRMFNAIDDMMEELKKYPWKQVLLPMGNDWFHVDSVRMTTTAGDHFLDVDSRYGRMFLAGLKCAAYVVMRLLELGAPIDCFYVPGNHDQTSSHALCCALAAYYLNEPQITFDLGMNPRKYRVCDGNLLGFAHGKDCKAGQFALIIGEECRDVWSQCTYREVNIGHTHQKREQQFTTHAPTNGLTVVTHPAMTNVDAYHHYHGLTGEPIKACEFRRYDKVAFRGSHLTYVRDDYNPNRKSLKVLQ